MKLHDGLNQESLFKYLVANERDELWGITVSTVGMHHVAPGDNYPPAIHPQEYSFDFMKGRVLNEYQLVYITRGGGIFKIGSSPAVNVREGDVLLITPGEWHTYKPDPDTGWDEYWVGFNGRTIDDLIRNGFFDGASSVHFMGINEEFVSLYNKIMEAAVEENAGYQQLIAGVVSHILSLMYFTGKNRKFADKEIINRVNKAKVIMQENIFNDITPEDIASELNLSYSWFRRAFKEYTGFSPAKYINELKLRKAKELLVTTSKSVKEISISLNFDNVEYFSTFFKKMTSKTPVEYRGASTRFK